MFINLILFIGSMGGFEISEYDLIFVCSVGVIVFEVKGWSNVFLIL